MRSLPGDVDMARHSSPLSRALGRARARFEAVPGPVGTDLLVLYEPSEHVSDTSRILARRYAVGHNIGPTHTLTRPASKILEDRIAAWVVARRRLSHRPCFINIATAHLRSRLVRAM